MKEQETIELVFPNGIEDIVLNLLLNDVFEHGYIEDTESARSCHSVCGYLNDEYFSMKICRLIPNDENASRSKAIRSIQMRLKGLLSNWFLL